MISVRRRPTLAACAVLLGASVGVATFAGCLVSFGEYDTHGSGGALASSSLAAGGAGGTVGIGGASSSAGGGGGTTCSNPPPGNIGSVAVGSGHACALVDGSPKTVWCWGDNTLSQVGEPKGGAAKAPTRVSFHSGFVPAILAAGGDHSCAASSKEVFCWGKNDAGQTVPGVVSMSSKPVRAFDLGSGSLSSLALGLEHTCEQDGSHGSCWGQTLGVGMGCSSMPCGVTDVSTDSNHDVKAPIAAITGGGFHTCIREGENVYCWGDNSHSQLGISSSAVLTSADLSTVDVHDALHVVAGKWHSCARQATGWTCWGMNAQGQLDGTASVDSASPLPAFQDFGDATTFAAGRAHTCAIAMTGAVTCWGANDQGQHGDGTSLGGPAKSDVPLPAGFKPKGISSRCDQTCAFDGHRVLCWGEARVDGCLDSASAAKSPPAVHEICWPP